MKYRSITEAQAIRAIEKHGILLAFPMDNRPQPDSLWSTHYPDKMIWEWDSGGDSRVADLWHLRTRLSESRKVVYAKWFRGRATFFSRDTFTDLLAINGTAKTSDVFSLAHLSTEAKQILETLEMSSPQSTKQLKAATELQGKFLSKKYDKAMKSLWDELRIVGFGEFEDGAFPSLGIGATHTLFEDLWDESKKRDPAPALTRLEKKLGRESLFFRHIKKKMT